MKVTFSGHETFVCRQFWLKKGYEHLIAGRSFSKDESVVQLGVGKNMTTAIKFWLRAFNIISEEEQITRFGELLVGGEDPYLEDSASLWLLHFMIVRSGKVFTFYSFFNQFLKEKNEFTKAHLIAFLKRKTQEHGLKHFSDKTYEADVNVFLRTYSRSQDSRVDVEEETANLLVELNLIRPFNRVAIDAKAGTQWFRVTRANRDELPSQIIIFTILDVYGEQMQSISFKELLEGINSPGNIFCLNEKALEERLEELGQRYPNQFNYNETAGNRVLQIKETLDKWTFLHAYYD